MECLQLADRIQSFSDRVPQCNPSLLFAAIHVSYLPGAICCEWLLFSTLCCDVLQREEMLGHVFLCRFSPIFIPSKAFWRTDGQPHALQGLSGRAWDGFRSYRLHLATIYINHTDPAVTLATDRTSTQQCGPLLTHTKRTSNSIEPRED